MAVDYRLPVLEVVLVNLVGHIADVDGEGVGLELGVDGNTQ